MTEPADSTAASSTASVKAKPSPTSPPSITSPASVSASVGICWPCSAIGARPTEIPTAMMPRTCGGMICEENSGAMKNSGVTRASTSTKPTSSPPASSVSSAFTRPPPDRAARSRAHHRRDRRVQRGGVGDELAEHPRAEQDDHHSHAGDLRDQRQALLLDLRDRLEDADHQADDQRDEQYRPCDLER